MNEIASEFVSEELVALYDPDDPVGRVVGAAPRSRMRAENLPHAASSILVRRSDGRILVHQRAASKDLWPSRFDLACGGVVAAGESPLDCARRELAEEVGIEGVELRPLLTTWYRDERTHGLVFLYETTWDGEVYFADGEVAEAWWLDPAELDAWLADENRVFVPDSSMLYPMIGDPVADDGPWPVGATVLYRFGRLGRSSFVRPATVIADGPDELVLWITEGTATVREVHRDGRDLREASLAERATGPRRRVVGQWRSHGIYVRIPARPTGWAVWHFFEADGRFSGWYGNLEAAQIRRRTCRGTYLVDTADHALDVWVPRPDSPASPLQPQWKDEDEFAAFTGLPHRWPAEQAPAIRAAGERFAALARAGAPPFDGCWTTPPAETVAAAQLPPDWDLPHIAGP